MKVTIATLNRLLQLHSRSLIVYLAECRPWTAPEQAARFEVIREIADAQSDLRDRIAECIVELDGVPDMGDFPLHFTRFNDLSIDFLFGELVERQRQSVQGIAGCVADLQDGPPAALAIAEEAHGAALGFLDRLVESTQPTGAAH